MELFPVKFLLSSLMLISWSDYASGNSLRIQPFSFPSDSAIGKRVSVTCTPLTGEKMEFKWLRNGQELASGRNNINILSYPLLSNLVIDPLTSEDSGNYTCVVSSRGLTGSYTTKLDVLVPPSWVITPSDTDASSGDSLMLHCKGSGRPEPLISWSVTLGTSGNSDFMPIIGSNKGTMFLNGSLYFEAITKEDEGMYKCNISNGIGNDLIKAVIVKVIGDGTFKIQPFSFPSRSVIGERITTICATSTNEKMVFKWLKNGKEIANSNNIQVRSFPEFSTLILDSLTEEDAGNYTCVASSRGFTETSTTVLEVLIPPSWSKFSNDIDAVNGDKISLDCFGTGKPFPTSVWSRTLDHTTEYSPIMNSTSMIILLNGTLILNDIRKEDEGLYKCVLSNGIGTQLQKTVVVKVIGMKIFENNFASFYGKRIS
ncbi:UNVERIFIED_CONTAM: Down syndrome cell adhesion molecule-like protein [Trichonephila clavipes]